jgi:ADP-dependent NAD(P)H-hydrate dehydratase / NAD(P)H-hydrate epimerase
MAAVTVSEMREAERVALDRGWSEESLLDLAGEGLGHALGRWFPQPGTVIAYLGKGHNAGDALVAMRVLRDHYGWTLALRGTAPFDQVAAITRRKWEQLGSPAPLPTIPETPPSRLPLLLLDGLLGIGAEGELRPPLANLVREMNTLRNQRGALIAAVDVPTGVCADSGEACAGALRADVTFMIGNAKRGLLMACAANHVGALALVPLEPLAAEGSGDLTLISPQTMNFAKAPRPYDFHKGMAGHVAILAACEAYTGAAVLAATGALRGGAGLVTLFIPRAIHQTVAAKCPPEVILRAFDSYDELSGHPADAWCIGCGLGGAEPTRMNHLMDFIASIKRPVVIDADALNWMAATNRSGILAANHVITPHPGEFRRLAPDLAALPREQAVRRFSDRHSATLLLKGCRTLVTQSGKTIWCNSTGTPGMACGGQGDLLAGVLSAKLAAGAEPVDAAAHSAWLCGRAAEVAMQSANTSEDSLLPSNVAARIGAAHKDWRLSTR